MLLPLIIAAALLWLALFSVYCYLSALPQRRARTRNTRRGGYVKPPASAPTKAGGQPTPATGTSALISSLPQPGSLSVVTGYLPLRVLRSKPSELGLFGSETGVAGANGARVLAKRVGSDAA